MVERSGIHIVMVTTYQLTPDCVNIYSTTTHTILENGSHHDNLIDTARPRPVRHRRPIPVDRDAARVAAPRPPAPPPGPARRSGGEGYRPPPLGHLRGNDEAVLAPLTDHDFLENQHGIAALPDRCLHRPALWGKPCRRGGAGRLAARQDAPGHCL